MKLFKDMDSEQFWMSVWSLAATVVLVIITIVSIGGWHQDKLLHDLVMKGEDPLELSCLFNASSGSIEIPCLVIAQEKAKTYVTK